MLCLRELRLISLGIAVGIAPAQVSRPTRVPEFRADADLVLIPASVTDRAGHTVLDLGATGFTVLEDGKPQEVVSVSRWNGSASLGVVIDASRSMRRVFQGAKLATALLFADLEPGDEGFLISFGDSPQLALDFTKTPVRSRADWLRSCLTGPRRCGMRSIWD